jgi:hypothetical protein
LAGGLACAGSGAGSGAGTAVLEIRAHRISKSGSPALPISPINNFDWTRRPGPPKVALGMKEAQIQPIDAERVFSRQPQQAAEASSFITETLDCSCRRPGMTNLMLRTVLYDSTAQNKKGQN